MSWNPNEKEVIAAFKLPAPERYKYLVKKIVNQESVWSLGNGPAWVMAASTKAKEVMPIWPHAHFALVCASGEWEGSLPKSVSLQSWLDRWLPGMERDNRLVAVFPGVHDQGLIVEASVLAADIRTELLTCE